MLLILEASCERKEGMDGMESKSLSDMFGDSYSWRFADRGVVGILEMFIVGSLVIILVILMSLDFLGASLTSGV